MPAIPAITKAPRQPNGMAMNGIRIGALMAPTLEIALIRPKPTER